MRLLLRYTSFLALAAALAALSGCAALNTASVAAPHAGSAAAISGSVHGGQQPVGGATVQLISPGSNGYGSLSTNGSVLVTTVSDANGNFSLPRPYTCPATNDTVTLLVATGGNSGSGTNLALEEAALLGSCASLSAATQVNISEVTTVAAAYALAPFTTVGGTFNANSTASLADFMVGTSATNTRGLSNVLGPANNLVNTVTGNARGVNELPGMVLPTAEMNTLADILASCVNSNGSTASTATCGMLFAAATPPGGTAPTTTLGAAFDIALNPGNNAAALYALSSASAPFQPTLTKAPGDFAVAIQFTGGQIGGSNSIQGLAVDALGDLWVGNTNGNTATRSLSEISPAGVFLSGANGFLNNVVRSPQGVTIDPNGNVFVAQAGSNQVLEVNSTGTLINTFSPASLNTPTGLAVNNRDGTLWVGNTGNVLTSSGQNDFLGTTVSHLTAAGADAAGSPYSGENGPFGVAIDGTGNIWVANTGANDGANSGNASLAKFTPGSGGVYSQQLFSTGSGSYPADVAIDNAGSVWTTLAANIGKYSNAGVQQFASQRLGYDYPESIAIDGLGRAFVSNLNSASGATFGYMTVFDTNGTLLSTANGSQGYSAAGTVPVAPFFPLGLAIDGSGCVWISGSGASTQFVTEIIGVAAPVVTPLSVAAQNNTLGTRP